MASDPIRARAKRIDSLSGPRPDLALGDRQARVLRALVAAYVGQAGPVSSRALSLLLSERLSPASIRNTLAELQAAGLVDKAHASAGRVPTPLGLAVFVDRLLECPDLGPHEQRMLDRALDGVDAEGTPRETSHLLSERTRQLGFVLTPRVDRLRLRTVHLVPLTDRRVLAVLVAENGAAIQRIVETPEPLGTRELERVGGLLAERVAGRTLAELRRRLEGERQRLRGEADQWLRRAWTLGLRACEAESEADLVVSSRLALLSQPEFSDPERIRGLFSALETNQSLLELLQRIGTAESGSVEVGLSMSLGQALGEPSLRDCALVAVPYGPLPARDPGREPGPEGEGASGPEPLGVLGVIGPQRMDYGRVIPLVRYCAELVTRKMTASGPDRMDS